MTGTVDSNQTNQTILVVDDEPLARKMASLIVRHAGHRPIEARDACQALCLLEEHPEIQVVVTDVNMPGPMDGLNLAAVAHRRWPPLKFIIVSGKARPHPEEMPTGAHFLAKPYDARVVEALLETMT